MRKQDKHSPESNALEYGIVFLTRHVAKFNWFSLLFQNEDTVSLEHLSQEE